VSIRGFDARSMSEGRHSGKNGAMITRHGKPGTRLALVSGAILILLAAMAIDTKAVKIGSAADVQSDIFSPATYGRSEFPKVQAAIESRAVDAEPWRLC